MQGRTIYSITVLQLQEWKEIQSIQKRNSDLVDAVLFHKKRFYLCFFFTRVTEGNQSLRNIIGCINDFISRTNICHRYIQFRTSKVLYVTIDFENFFTSFQSLNSCFLFNKFTMISYHISDS